MSKLLRKVRMRRNRSQYQNEYDSAPSFRRIERWIRVDFLSQDMTRSRLRLWNYRNLIICLKFVWNENVTGSRWNVWFPPRVILNKVFVSINSEKWKLKSTIFALSHDVFYNWAHRRCFHISHYLDSFMGSITRCYWINNVRFIKLYYYHCNWCK